MPHDYVNRAPAKPITEQPEHPFWGVVALLGMFTLAFGCYIYL